MTIASETNRSGPYSCNGATTSWPYSFKIYDEKYVSVVLTDAGGNDTTLTLGTDYTVSGVGEDGGGAITTTAVYAAGNEITLLLNVPFTQETDLQNQGAFYAETIERGLDLAAQRALQLKELIGRAVVLSVTSDVSTEVLTTAIVALNGILTEMRTLAAISADIETVAGISDAVSGAEENATTASTAAGTATTAAGTATTQAGIATEAAKAAAASAASAALGTVKTFNERSPDAAGNIAPQAGDYTAEDVGAVPSEGTKAFGLARLADADAAAARSALELGSAALADVADIGPKPGTLAMWPAETPPDGALVRNGATISRTTYADLFAVIGTTYGAGDGSTTFALPDDRGNVERGWDGGRSVDPSRVFGSEQLGSVIHQQVNPGTYRITVDNVLVTGSESSSTGGDSSSSSTSYLYELRMRNRAYLPIIYY